MMKKIDLNALLEEKAPVLDLVDGFDKVTLSYDVFDPDGDTVRTLSLKRLDEDVFVMTRNIECLHPYDEDMDKRDKDYEEFDVDPDDPFFPALSCFKLLINEIKEAEFDEYGERYAIVGNPMIGDRKVITPVMKAVFEKFIELVGRADFRDIFDTITYDEFEEDEE